MIRKTILIVAVLMFSASAASATPSFIGPTGLLSVPTAEVVRRGDIELAASHVSYGGADSHLSLTGNYGAWDRLEVGASYVSPSGGSGRIVFNAKYLLLQEAAAMPAVALGLNNITSAGDAGIEIYGVMSRHMELLDAVLSAGLMAEGSDTRLVAGLAIPFMGLSEVIVEQNRHINLGVRLHLPVLPIDIDLAVFDLLEERSLGLSASYLLSF